MRRRRGTAQTQKVRYPRQQLRGEDEGGSSSQNGTFDDLPDVCYVADASLQSEEHGDGGATDRDLQGGRA
eukprot:1597523-Lingulodinium_polyedra.AAC.1